MERLKHKTTIYLSEENWQLLQQAPHNTRSFLCNALVRAGCSTSEGKAIMGLFDVGQKVKKAGGE